MSDSFASNTEYDEVIFSGIQLSNEQFKNVRFEQCTFESCRWVQCTFTDCSFIDCSFRESQLSAVKLKHCSFMETSFKDSKVIGIDWSVTTTTRSLHFMRCDISQSVFDSMKLSDFVLKESVAKEADFTNVDCSGADFEHTDFARAVFRQTNLTGSDFRHAKNYAIDFQNNTIKKAKFSLPEAVSLLSCLDISVEY